MVAVNRRLGERGDIRLMEAMTLFDDRAKEKEYNRERRVEYMERLCAQFPPQDDVEVRNGAVSWFGEATKHNERTTIIDHFAGFCRGANASIQPFAEWAINICNKFLSNSVLEHGFSILTMFKSKYRGSLGDDKLRVPLIMRSEEKFEDVAFLAFWDGFRKYVDSTGDKSLNKELRGTNKKRKQMEDKPGGC